MAKDPAFLFYPGDFIAGTMHLDLECTGGYMKLLMLQFQKDHMNSHMIKQVLGHRYNHIWPLISDKFKEKDGFYYNERLRVEKEKRIKFCNSRRENRNTPNAEGTHMSSHMENVNSINKYNKGVFRKKIKGVAFEGDEVIFADGSIQKLGPVQKDLLQMGELKPRDVTYGLVN